MKNTFLLSLSLFSFKKVLKTKPLSGVKTGFPSIREISASLCARTAGSLISLTYSAKSRANSGSLRDLLIRSTSSVVTSNEEEDIKNKKKLTTTSLITLFCCVGVLPPASELWRCGSLSPLGPSRSTLSVLEAGAACSSQPILAYNLTARETKVLTTAFPRNFRFHAHQRRPLRVVMRLWGDPFSFPTLGTGYEDGYFPTVLRTAAELAGVAVAITLVNASSDAVLSSVENGTFDAAFGADVVSSRWVDRVDFTVPWIDSSMSLVVQDSTVIEDSWRYFSPFTFWVWICLALYLGLAALTLWALERRAETYTGVRFDCEIRPGWRGLWDAASFTYFVAWLPGMMDVRVRGAWARVYCASVLLGLFFILEAYSANLASFLTVPRLTGTISGFEDLKGSNTLAYYADGSRRSNIYESLRARGFRDAQLRPFQDPSLAAALMQAGAVDAVVHETAMARAMVKKYCQYKIAGRSADGWNWAMAFPRGSPLVPVFNQVIVTSKSLGALAQTEKVWLQSADSCTEGSDFTTPQAAQLSAESFAPIFIGLYGFAIIAALWVACTAIWNRLRGRTEPPRRLIKPRILQAEIEQVQDEKEKGREIEIQEPEEKPEEEEEEDIEMGYNTETN